MYANTVERPLQVKELIEDMKGAMRVKGEQNRNSRLTQRKANKTFNHM